MKLSKAILWRIKIGMRVGIAVATVLALWVLLGYYLRGVRTVEESGTSMIVLVLSYFVGGALAGALVGGLSPIGKSLPGKMLLGVLASLICFFCVQSTLKGPVWVWSRKTLLDTTMVAAVVGMIGGPWAARDL